LLVGKKVVDFGRDHFKESKDKGADLVNERRTVRKLGGGGERDLLPLLSTKERSGQLSAKRRSNPTK